MEGERNIARPVITRYLQWVMIEVKYFAATRCILIRGNLGSDRGLFKVLMRGKIKSLILLKKDEEDILHIPVSVFRDTAWPNLLSSGFNG
jgi:hypothetical protein